MVLAWSGACFACSEPVPAAASGGDALSIEVADVAELSMEVDGSVDAKVSTDAQVADSAPADALADAGADAPADVQPDSAADAAPDGSSEVSADMSAETVLGCSMPSSAGHHEAKCQGLVFDLHVPAACAKGGCGLVVDVHGATMDAEMQDYNTDLRALGEQLGYVVVQPNAMPPPPTSAWLTADDAVVLDFTKSAIVALAIDSKRVHFTGFSQGGWMGWRMVCKQPDLFASVAIAAACSSYGGEGCSFQAGQVPSKPLPVLYMHGKLDVLQPWWCAEQQIAGLTKGWQLKQTQVVAQDSDHLWQRLATPGGTTVELVQHSYSALSPALGGHCYPGSPDVFPKYFGQVAGFGCTGKSAFHWGKVAMGFFAAHPKP